MSLALNRVVKPIVFILLNGASEGTQKTGTSTSETTEAVFVPIKKLSQPVAPEVHKNRKDECPVENGGRIVIPGDGVPDQGNNR